MVGHRQVGVGRCFLGDEAHPGQLRRPVPGMPAQHGDRARRRRQQTHRQMQQGGLAGTVRSDQADHMSRRYLQAAVGQRPAPTPYRLPRPSAARTAVTLPPR